MQEFVKKTCNSQNAEEMFTHLAIKKIILKYCMYIITIEGKLKPNDNLPSE